MHLTTVASIVLPALAAALPPGTPDPTQPQIAQCQFVVQKQIDEAGYGSGVTGLFNAWIDTPQGRIGRCSSGKVDGHFKIQSALPNTFEFWIDQSTQTFNPSGFTGHYSYKNNALGTTVTNSFQDKNAKGAYCQSTGTGGRPFTDEMETTCNFACDPVNGPYIAINDPHNPPECNFNG